jgi:predicted nucleic acid-binding protein
VSGECFVLDTSALLAFMTAEKGAEVIEGILNGKGNRIYLPWPVVFEVYYLTKRSRGEADADRRYALISELPATILWRTDEPEVLAAARLKAQFRISFADAIIAAAAVQLDAILVHKDPEYEHLGKQIRLKRLSE